MKLLILLFVILSTVFFSYSIVAQDFGSLKKESVFSIPEKINKLVLDPLPAGTYSVGSGGYFPTIDSAFSKLSIDGISGEVKLELIDELYTAPTDSFGFLLNGPIPGAGPNSRVTIKPAENENVVIEGNGFRVMCLINTSYLTIDGIGLTGTTTLTFHALYNPSFSWNDCLNFHYNSDHNIVKYITFISEDFYRFGGSIWMNSSTTDAPDSNLIINNFIKKGSATYLNGPASGGIRPEGNIIRGNFIGSETDSLINWGIQVEVCRNTIVENNIIQNLKVLNTVGEQLVLGINSYWGQGDVIRNNMIRNIKAPGGYTGVGILLSGGGLGNGNSVYNNMISDIQSSSAQSNSRVAGIQIWNQTYPKIYYNTVYLSGSGANPLGSAAFYVYGSFGNSLNVDLKNNIFVNIRDEGQYCASAIYNYTYVNLTSDYNDLLYDDTNNNNCLVRIGNLDYLTLADWQVQGKDLNSITEMPNFVGPHDLHIVENLLTLIDGGATPIAGIVTDIDGEVRDATLPDIGADEFDIVSAEDEGTIPTEFALEQNFPNPFNPSTTFRFSIPTQSEAVIKVFDILGNEVATLMDEEKPVGTYELTWNAEGLPSGVYFYQLKAGSFVETKKMILLK